MKRFALLSLALCALFIFTACGQATPAWLEKGTKSGFVWSWSAEVQEDAMVSTVYCVPDETGGSTAYRYRLGEGITATADSSGSASTALVAGELPGIAKAIILWMGENRSDKEYSLAYVQPQYIFAADEPAESPLSYSLKTGKLTPVDGEYSGSKEYGAITVFALSGTFQVYIND